MTRPGIVAVAILASACDGSGAGAGAGAPPPDVDGGESGTCAAGTTPGASGCVPAGVPPDGCAPGFEHDGAGCVAVLPERVCPPGQMALPGETTCRDVAPCPPGKWGEIPVEATTQYVDASYPGDDSDGSAERPWKWIYDGVFAALPGAIVAVAEGSYPEDVAFNQKAVRVWGVCPARVEIVGPRGASALFAGNDTEGTEIRDLAITGDYAFTSVSGGKVILHRVWIHDSQRPAVTIADLEGAPELHIVDSLVENSGEVAVLVIGSHVVFERSVVRGTRAGATGLVAGAVSSVSGIDTGARASIVIRDSLLYDNQGAGVATLGGDIEVEGSLIRDTNAVPMNGQDGEGIVGAFEIETGYRASVIVRSSVVERSREAGIFLVDSDGVLDLVTVRDTLPQQAGPKAARGIVIQRSEMATAVPKGTITRSSVLRSAGFGVVVSDGELTLTSVLVSETTPEVSGGTFGDGVVALSLWQNASANIASSRIESSARAGVVSFGAAVSISDSRLECNGVHLDGEPSDHGTFTFDDAGGNACGCDGAEVICSVLKSSLTPPDF